MRINPITTTNKLARTTSRNMYDLKLQNAKNNLQRSAYVEQIKRDYFERNIKPQQ
ncbi:hypothetical protein J6Q66_04945 [bacterium]|nr:hypothetical protein [bacterium]